MKGAERPRRRFEEWPKEDRDRWRAAFKTGDIFDDNGRGAHLAQATIKGIRYQYDWFLGSLAVKHPNLLEQPPAKRINPQIVAELVADRRATCRETTIVSDLLKLRHGLILLCPENDWSWLLAIIKRIAVKARPLPPRNSEITSEQLYALGIDLMDRAASAAIVLAVPTKSHALQYRDGLLIALLACIPLRRRTAAAIRIEKQLVRAGQLWALDIPAEDTKSRRAMEFSLWAELSERIDTYLSKFRGSIPGASRHDGLWASNKGRCMDGGAIYDMVCRRTCTGFGFPVNLHRFRRAAATFWALEDPENVLGIKDLLGHYSFATANNHYITKQSRVAGRKLSNIIDGHARNPRPRRSL